MNGSQTTRTLWRRIQVGSLSLLGLLSSLSCAAPKEVGDWMDELPDANAPQAVWVFRSQDCLSCQSTDFFLRKAQRITAGRLSITAIHVGWDDDSLVARSFLEKARLVANVVHLSPTTYASYWPGKTPPHLLLLKDRRVVWDQEGENPAQADSTFWSAVSVLVEGVAPEG